MLQCGVSMCMLQLSLLLASAFAQSSENLRRDEPYAANWLTTHASRACEGNQENIAPYTARSAPAVQDCMRACEGLWGCLAVDFYRKTNVCNLYRNACTTPGADHDGASSYRIARSVVWATISTEAACKGAVDLYKELGEIQTLAACKQLCENHAGCIAVDFYTTTRVCQMYDEACDKPTFVQDGSQSHKIQRPVNWILTSGTRGCESNADRAEFHKKIHMPEGGLPACKQLCERRSDCRAVDFYTATGWCVIYKDACTHPLSTADGVQSWRVLREGFPKSTSDVPRFFRKESAAKSSAVAPSLWSTIDADNACQASREDVRHFKEIQLPDETTVDDCRTQCENNGRCTAVDYFRVTRYCLLYDQACTSPAANHDGASSMRLVRADLASTQVEFGTAVALVASPDQDATTRINRDAFERQHTASSAIEKKAVTTSWVDKLRAKLEALDIDGSGYLPSESLVSVVQSQENARDLTADKLQAMLADAAVGDGHVDYMDFLGFLKLVT